jgi:signal transduction protein with GAF and PtsI domain
MKGKMSLSAKDNDEREMEVLISDGRRLTVIINVGVGNDGQRRA